MSLQNCSGRKVVPLPCQWWIRLFHLKKPPPAVVILQPTFSLPLGSHCFLRPSELTGTLLGSSLNSCTRCWWLIPLCFLVCLVFSCPTTEDLHTADTTGLLAQLQTSQSSTSALLKPVSFLSSSNTGNGLLELLLPLLQDYTLCHMPLSLRLGCNHHGISSPSWPSLYGTKGCLVLAHPSSVRLTLAACQIQHLPLSRSPLHPHPLPTSQLGIVVSPWVQQVFTTSPSTSSPQEPNPYIPGTWKTLCPQDINSPPFHLTIMKSSSLPHHLVWLISTPLSSYFPTFSTECSMGLFMDMFPQFTSFSNFCWCSLPEVASSLMLPFV